MCANKSNADGFSVQTVPYIRKSVCFINEWVEFGKRFSKVNFCASKDIGLVRMQLIKSVLKYA